MLKDTTKVIKLNNNKSFCPVCLVIVESNIIEKNGKIYLDIYCPAHGKFENLHKWGEPGYYKTMDRPEMEYIDKYPMGLLIETNFDCNQNCNFCYAQANERKESNPTLEEIIEKADGFKGVLVTLAGGEPTLRGDLPTIIRELKKRKFTVILCSNGKKLADKAYVTKLRDAGLDTVQLQFDTMDDSQYEFIRKERLNDLKSKVINNLKEAGISIYLFVALIKGVNDNQVKNIISFAAKNSSAIKIVFLVPIWSEGRTMEHNSITIKEIVELLQREYNLKEDAFKDYAKFDFYSSWLYQRLTNKPFIKYQPCTVSYYFFYIRKSIIPLSELIDIKKFNYFLERAHNLLSGKGFLKKFCFLFVISCPFFIKEVLPNKKIRPFIFSLLRTLFLHILFDKSPKIKDNYSLQVRVEGFFDRYNSDFRMLKQCNLYTHLKGELVPFCHMEIARKKCLM